MIYAAAGLDEAFMAITVWRESVATLEAAGIDETAGEIVTVNGLPILLEQEGDMLYASFVQHHNLYEVVTTLPQAEALAVIESLPTS